MNIIKQVTEVTDIFMKLYIIYKYKKSKFNILNILYYIGFVQKDPKP